MKRARCGCCDEYISKNEPIKYFEGKRICQDCWDRRNLKRFKERLLIKRMME